MISYYVNTTPWFLDYYQEFYILKNYIINNSTGGIVKSFEHQEVFFVRLKNALEPPQEWRVFTGLFK